MRVAISPRFAMRSRLIGRAGARDIGKQVRFCDRMVVIRILLVQYEVLAQLLRVVAGRIRFPVEGHTMNKSVDEMPIIDMFINEILIDTAILPT